MRKSYFHYSIGHSHHLLLPPQTPAPPRLPPASDEGSPPSPNILIEGEATSLRPRTPPGRGDSLPWQGVTETRLRRKLNTTMFILGILSTCLPWFWTYRLRFHEARQLVNQIPIKNLEVTRQLERLVTKEIKNIYISADFRRWAKTYSDQPAPHRSNTIHSIFCCGAILVDSHNSIERAYGRDCQFKPKLSVVVIGKYRHQISSLGHHCWVGCAFNIVCWLNKSHGKTIFTVNTNPIELISRGLHGKRECGVLVYLRGRLLWKSDESHGFEFGWVFNLLGTFEFRI